MVNRSTLLPYQVAAKLLSLKNSNQAVFLHFTASLKQGTNQKWCPDCREADPIIDETLADEGLPASVTFIDVALERDLWKNAENEFRKPPFSISSIPTIVKYDTNSGQFIRKRIVESECQQLELLNEYLKS